MLTVNLPELVAGRDMAGEIVDKLGSLAGQVVVLDCGRVVNGTASFAAEIVQRVLGEDRTARLVVKGAPPRFLDYIERAAAQLAVADRLTSPPDEASVDSSASRRSVG